MEEEKKQNINIEKKDNFSKHNILIKDNIISFLKIQLKELEKKILEKEVHTEKEILNIHSRINRDIQNFRKFSLEKIIIDFLIVADSIESSLTLMQSNISSEINVNIIEKLKSSDILLKEIFQSFNIRKINDINVLFNPNIHQAMSINYNNDIEDNQVVQVMQSGYILHESRLLRPAMVIVSKKKYNT